MSAPQTASPFEPLSESVTLADGAYDKIRRAILSGDLNPGTRLSVPDLASSLGVSRSPIREAIIRLEREGLAISSRNRGAVVATPDGRDLRNLYDVRSVLEGLAARRASERATEADLAALEELWSHHEAAVADGDLDRHLVTDLEFHRRLRDVSGNPRIIEVLDLLSNQIRLAMYATASQPGNPALALRDHRAILDAVTARDPDRAELMARKHVERIRRSLPAEEDDFISADRE